MREDACLALVEAPLVEHVAQQHHDGLGRVPLAPVTGPDGHAALEDSGTRIGTVHPDGPDGIPGARLLDDKPKTVSVPGRPGLFTGPGPKPLTGPGNPHEIRQRLLFLGEPHERPQSPASTPRSRTRSPTQRAPTGFFDQEG